MRTGSRTVTSTSDSALRKHGEREGGYEEQTLRACQFVLR